jgi:xanthine dehydrogenase small subunit
VTLEQAALALRNDYTPLTDVRATSAYRLDAAAALLMRIWHKAPSLFDLEPIDG